MAAKTVWCANWKRAKGGEEVRCNQIDMRPGYIVVIVGGRARIALKARPERRSGYCDQCRFAREVAG